MDLTDPRFLLVAGCVFVGFAAEATVGFGAVVVTLALAAALYPIDTLLATIVPLNLTLSAYIVVRHHGHADRALIGKRILPVMGIGMALGLVVFERAPRELLQRLFGVFVTALAAWELALLRTKARRMRERATARRAQAIETVATLGAGVIHGLFSSGGPLLVWSLEHAGLRKSAFRSTLSIVWLVLGALLTLAYARGGRLTAASLLATAALLPVVALAVASGEWLHHRLDEARFRGAIFGLLLVAGLANLLR